MTKPTFKPASIGNLGDTMVAILATENTVLEAILHELHRVQSMSASLNHVDFLGNIDVLLRVGQREHVAKTFAKLLREPHMTRISLCNTINTALDALGTRGVFGVGAERDPRGSRVATS